MDVLEAREGGRGRTMSEAKELVSLSFSLSSSVLTLSSTLPLASFTFSSSVLNTL